jgi:hypothetical protein
MWCGYRHVVRRVRTDGKGITGLGLGGIVSSLCGAVEVSDTHSAHTSISKFTPTHPTTIATSILTSHLTAQTVITDYPAPDILSNLQRNITSAVPSTISPPSRPTVQGHEWGVLDDDFSVKNKGGFTRVIAAGTFH